MSLTKVSYSMISGAPTNVMDYIPPSVNPATTDVTTYFAQALAVNKSLYVPNGTYVLGDLKLETGYKIVGQNKKSVIFKGTATTTKIIKSNDSVTDYANLPSFVTDLVLENFTLDMSAMTDLNTYNGIYLTCSYNNVIRNISYITDSTFPLNANPLNIDGFVYTTSVYDCYFPFVRCYGKVPIGAVNGYTTTISFYNLNSYGVEMGYVNSTSFFEPILQKEYDKFSFGVGVSNITIIGGDIEQANEKYYLNGNGNFVSNITSLNNAFGGLQGGYKDSASTWASCNFFDQYTIYGPRYFSALTRSGTTATGTTTQNHMLTSGDSCQIVGASDANFNGFVTVTVTGVKTFTYTVANTGATNGYVSGSYVSPDWQGNGGKWYPLGTLSFYRNVSGSRWLTDNLYNSGNLYLGSESAISDNRGIVLAAGGSKVGFEYQTPTDAYYPAIFYNAAGTSVGNIVCSSVATTYNIASDQRLKTDLGVVTSTDVIAKTIIHDFTWFDNTKGRGVFAQEAHTVKPDAVFVGSDERNEQGHLIHPWAVDYSKYVPDLIVELQALRKEFEAYKASHP